MKLLTGGANKPRSRRSPRRRYHFSIYELERIRRRERLTIADFASRHRLGDIVVYKSLLKKGWTYSRRLSDRLQVAFGDSVEYSVADFRRYLREAAKS